MKYVKLGRTGLKVSQICLGTGDYGEAASETECMNVMKRAIAAGVNFIDTSDIYTNTISEQIVGRALKGERHSVVLATKVGGPTGPGPNDSGLSRRHILRAVEDSLKRLQTDYIDLYYAHFPDYDTSIEETMRSFDDLVRHGKVRYIGCSNFSAWRICKALRVSELYSLERFECVEPPYNLLARDIENELLPLCANEGIGVCVYSPLAGSMLSGKYKFNKLPTKGKFAHPRWGPRFRSRYWSAMCFEAIEKLKRVAREHGCSLSQFAMAWVLSNKTITSAISGTTSVKHMEENIAATEIELLKEELIVCDSIWQMFRPASHPYANNLP